MMKVVRISQWTLQKPDKMAPSRISKYFIFKKEVDRIVE